MGGGIGMGNTCKPMAVSFQCMTKFTTNKKKKWKKKEICLCYFLVKITIIKKHHCIHNISHDAAFLTLAGPSLKIMEVNGR